MKNRRTKYWINSEVQSGYIKFLFLFWFVCLGLSVLSFLFVTAIQLNNPETNSTAFQFINLYLKNPVLILIFLTFHFIISCLFGFYFFRSFSHRVCGPIYNIENKIRSINLAENSDQVFSEIEIRKNDYFQSFAAELNQLLKKKILTQKL